MPLAARAAVRPHTVVAFRAAAGARYREAVQLEVANRRLAAVYRYGYAAEMLLKAAYFRLAGWVPTAPITASGSGNHLNAAKTLATGTYGLQWSGNLHDLPSWSRLLIHEHGVRGQPFGPAFRNQLQSRVNRIYSHWRESLRYHDMMPYQGEVSAVRLAVNWLLVQYRRLQESIVPRHIIQAKRSPDRFEGLVKALAQELKASGGGVLPVILEQVSSRPMARYVTVIWDKWKGVPGWKPIGLVPNGSCSNRYRHRAIDSW